MSAFFKELVLCLKSPGSFFGNERFFHHRNHRRHRKDLVRILRRIRWIRWFHLLFPGYKLNLEVNFKLPKFKPKLLGRGTSPDISPVVCCNSGYPCVFHVALGRPPRSIARYVCVAQPQLSLESTGISAVSLRQLVKCPG